MTIFFRGVNSDFFHMQLIPISQPIYICPYFLVLLRFNNKNKILFLDKGLSFPAGVFLFFGFVRALGPNEDLKGTLLIISVSSFQIFFSELIQVMANFGYKCLRSKGVSKVIIVQLGAVSSHMERNQSRL